RYLWEPTDAFTVNLIGDYAHDRSTGEGDFFTFVKVDPGTAAALASCGVTAKPGNQKFCTAQNIRSHGDNYGASLQLDYDAGPVTLTSISAFRRGIAKANGSNIFRADPLPIEITGGATDNRIKLFTQEFRVASPSNTTLEYTAGAFASYQKSTQEPS